MANSTKLIAIFKGLLYLCFTKPKKENKRKHRAHAYLANIIRTKQREGKLTVMNQCRKKSR